MGSMLGGAALPAFSQEVKAPNVLMIVCDQLRYDCLGYTGNKIVSTPNIDKLAASGMQFTNAYTAIPTSCPARQCLLSGSWPEQPSHRGLWNYDIALPVNLFEGDTWTARLREKGYRMGYVGKWHVHPQKTPLDFGFEDYVTMADYKRWVGENQLAQKENYLHRKDNKMMGGYVDMPKEENIVYWYKDRAVDLIDEYRKGGTSWHLRLDYTEPHLPCFPLRSFYEKYSRKSIPEWGNFKDRLDDKPYIQYQQLLNWGIEDYSWNEWQNYMRSYYAIIEQVDDAIGMLLEELEKKGLLENTMIVFTTDHGDAAGSHRMLDKHYVMYEEEVHVPLIVSWKGRIAPATRCDKFLVHFLDIAATMNELLQLDFPTQGRSLMPLFRGEKVEDWRKYAFSNYNGQQFGLFVQRMIRDERYKYVWAPTDVDELYDLQNDPYELKNQIGNPEYSEVLTRLRKDLYHELVARKDAAAGRPTGAYKQLIEQKKR